VWWFNARINVCCNKGHIITPDNSYDVAQSHRKGAVARHCNLKATRYREAFWAVFTRPTMQQRTNSTISYRILAQSGSTYRCVWQNLYKLLFPIAFCQEKFCHSRWIRRPDLLQCKDTMWTYRVTLAFDLIWPWTLVMYRLCHGQTRYKILAKSNNPPLSYSHLKIEKSCSDVDWRTPYCSSPVCSEQKQTRRWQRSQPKNGLHFIQLLNVTECDASNDAASSAHRHFFVKKDTYIGACI